MKQKSDDSKLFDFWLQKLKIKWGQVPGAGFDRYRTSHLLLLSPEELHSFWLQQLQSDTEGARYNVRGWYHTLYMDIFRDKKILDVGAGLGIDALFFAQNEAAHITCIDLVSTNLKVLKKISSFLNLSNISFFLLEDLESIASLPYDYDVIWCQGSMINIPFEVAQTEARALLEHLKPEGRWIELAYPKTRWIREGKIPFEKWGDKTDGGAPWIEWYDLNKILQRLAPSQFDTVLAFEFHDSDFIWFDLKRKKCP